MTASQRLFGIENSISKKGLMEKLSRRMEIYPEKLNPGSALFIRGLIEQKLLSLSPEWDWNMRAMGLWGCWELWVTSRGEVGLELGLGKAEQKCENRAADGRGNCLSILLPWYFVSRNVPVPPDLQRMRLWRKDILPCLQLAAKAAVSASTADQGPKAGPWMLDLIQYHLESTWSVITYTYSL